MSTPGEYPRFANDRIHLEDASILARPILMGEVTINDLVIAHEVDVDYALSRRGAEETYKTEKAIPLASSSPLLSLANPDLPYYPYRFATVTGSQSRHLSQTNLNEATILLNSHTLANCARIKITRDNKDKELVFETQEADTISRLEKAPLNQLTAEEAKYLLIELLIQAKTPTDELFRLKTVEDMLSALASKSSKPSFKRSGECSWDRQYEGRTTFTVTQYGNRIGSTVLAGMSLELSTVRNLPRKSGVLKTITKVEGGRSRAPIAKLWAGIERTSLEQIPYAERDRIFDRTIGNLVAPTKVKGRLQDALGRLQANPQADN